LFSILAYLLSLMIYFMLLYNPNIKNCSDIKRSLIKARKNYVIGL
jgi:hypothetical protein